MTDQPVSYFPVDDPAARLPAGAARADPAAAAETALIIVDMQNAYASPGGYLDLAGFDISGAAPAIEKIAQAADAARAAGMPVIFFQNGWDPDYVEAGGPGSPNWHKSNALKTMRARPELQGTAAGQGRLGLRAGRRRCRRSPATSSSRSRATAPSSTPTSTACCARAASARWSSPASPPTSASSRRCATASSSNISASCCTTRRTRPGPTSSRRRRSTTSRSSSAGCRRSSEFRTALCRPTINPHGHPDWANLKGET